MRATMLVEELIERLRECPATARVVCRGTLQVCWDEDTDTVGYEQPIDRVAYDRGEVILTLSMGA